MTRWRPVAGAPDYEVSDDGQVRSHKYREPRIRKTTTNGKGHRVVALRVGGGYHYRYVHDLVLTAFVGPRPAGAITRHLNGRPDDNRVGNLAWGTPSENQQDRVRHLREEIADQLADKYRAGRGSGTAA